MFGDSPRDKFGVYCIHNKKTNRVYVGYCKLPIKQRFRGHIRNAFYNNSMSPLSIALREDGIDNFTWYILSREAFEDDARNKEIYFIKLLKSMWFENGYNQRMPKEIKGMYEFYYNHNTDKELKRMWGKGLPFLEL